MISLLSRRRRLAPSLVGLAFLLLASCQTHAPRELPGEDRLLETLMEEYVAERFRFYPVESTLAGLPGGDDRLGSFSRADVERRIDWLADFHRKLIGLRLQSLSQPAYLDALWLTSLVKAEILDLEERRVWEKSARFYTEPIRTGLTSLLLDPDVASRTSALAGRLDEIPTLFDQASENLRVGPGPWRDDGLAALGLCRELLADLPQLLTERVPAYRVAELAERSRKAMRSLQSLMNRLQSAEEVEPGWEPLGVSILERHLLYSEMVDGSADEILAEARTTLEARTNDLTALALESFSGRPIRELLSRSEPPPEVREAVERAEAQARVFARKLGPPFPLGRSVPVVSVGRYFVAPDVVRLFRPAALEPAKGAFLIVDVTSKPPDEDVLRLQTLGEVAVRSRQYAFQSEATSLLRRVVSTRSAAEGFRSWSVTRFLERGYGGGDAELRLRDRHGAILEMIRLIATIRLHTGGAGLLEAERLFREEGFLSPDAARLEARGAALDPGVGSAGLGRLLLGRLARDYFRAHPLDTEADLVEAILAEGALPLRLVRFKLLGIEPGA